MMRHAIAAVALAITAFFTQTASAGARSAVVREAVDYVLKKFGVEVAEELGENAAEVLARRIETLALRAGEKEAVEAVQKVGPRVFRLVDNIADDQVEAAVRILAKHGDEAGWVVGNSRRLGLLTRHGDEAAEVMLRHKSIADDVIEQYGDSAVKALRSVDGRNARRLAMMSAPDSELARIAAPNKLLDVVSKHGDKAMDWVWRNKGALATAAVLTAFVENPQPFIDGTLTVAKLGTESIVKPAIDQTTKGLVNRPAWLFATIVVLIGVPGYMLWRRLGRFVRTA